MLGLVVYIVVGLVTWFLVPSEVGKMYATGRAARRPSPAGRGSGSSHSGSSSSAAIVWFMKIQGALNRYWESESTGSLPVTQPTAA